MSGKGEMQATWTLNADGNFEEKLQENAQSADKLQESIDRDIKSLREMQRALSNLKGGALGSTAQAKDLKDRIAAQKSLIAGQQSMLLRLGVDWKKLGTQTAEATKRQNASIKGLSVTSESSFGAMLKRVEALNGRIGKAGMVGLIAFAVTKYLALAAAIAAASRALASYALRVLDARRSELLRFEGLTKMPNYWGIAAGKATDLQASVDRVTSSVSLGRDKVVEFATWLYRAGLRGKNLDAALEGTALRASVLGEEMGTAFGGMAMGAALTGQSVVRMTEVVKRQLGGVAARQMLSFSVQVQKARENVDAMFRGVKIEGFLVKFATITELFSQTTATGRALKVMLETLLNPLFGSADGGAPILKRFFQGMVIGALYVTIAILKLRKFWKESFGEMGIKVNWAKVALYGGIAVVGLLTIAVIGLTAVVTALGVAVGATVGVAWLLFARLALMVGGVVLAIGTALTASVAWIVGNYRKAFEFLRSIDWSEVGTAIVDGIASGLSKLWEMGKELGNRMLKGFKEAWGIKSPSHVARGLVRKDIAGGMVLGARDAHPRVSRAIGGMSVPRAGVGIGVGARVGAAVGLGMRLGGPPMPLAGNPYARRLGPRIPEGNSSAGFGSKSTAGFSISLGKRRDDGPAIAGRLGRKPPPPAGGGRGLHLEIGELHIHSSSSDPKELARAAVGEISQQLEVALIEMGVL